MRCRSAAKRERGEISPGSLWKHFPVNLLQGVGGTIERGRRIHAHRSIGRLWMCAGMINESVFIQRGQIRRRRRTMLELGIEIAAGQQAIRTVWTIAIAACFQATEAGAIIDIIRQTQSPDGTRDDQQRDSNADHEQGCTKILRRMFNQTRRTQHNAAQGAGHASQRKDANDKGQRGSCEPFA